MPGMLRKSVDQEIYGLSGSEDEDGPYPVVEIFKEIMKMNRRYFFEKGLVAGAAAASVSCQKNADSAPLKRKKALMYPGTQAFRDSDAELEFLVRHGITNKVGYPAISPKSRTYQLEDLEKLIEQNDKHGVRVDMVPLPIDQMYA